MATYKATLIGHHAGILIEPGFHVKTVPPPLGDEPAPDDVATGVWGAISGAVLDASHLDLHWDELVLTEQVVPPDLGAAGSHTINANGTYAPTGSYLPQGLVAIFNLHSAVRSRSARGHFAWPCPPQASAVDGQNISAQALVHLNALRDAMPVDIMIGSVTQTRVRQVCYSRKRHLLSEDPYDFDVTSVSINPTCHWLRSRMTTP